MSLFFITFFLTYGSMHIYAFLRAKAALKFGLRAGVLISFIMAVMLFAPILIRQAERMGFEHSARLLSFMGYGWLGVLFLFTSASLIVDLYRFLLHSAELLSRNDFSFVRPGAGAIFYLPLILSLFISVYGYYEAANIRAEKITIYTSKVPKSSEKLRVVQISDVHLGLIIRNERLARILRLVIDSKPDILVSTGDLVDGQINGMPGLAEMFNSINPHYGKYAVTGNHEYYAGLEQSLEFTKKAGFRILRDEALTIPGIINIAGVDDRAVRPRSSESDGVEYDILRRLPRDYFTLFLKHRPLVNNASSDLFDLQLSGHVHRGQIFPFSIATMLYYPVDAGLVSVGNVSQLYVSRGTGTWGPPIRFLSPPEVTIIDIVGTL